MNEKDLLKKGEELLKKEEYDNSLEMFNKGIEI